ncbi:MAG: hypothetical protein M1546_13055 [Chloroflexi bacterium]|nr:hypothetical protein [Chloroflexota bacterium]
MLADAALNPLMLPYRQVVCRLYQQALPLTSALGADAFRVLGASCNPAALQWLLQVLSTGAWLPLVLAQAAITSTTLWHTQKPAANIRVKGQPCRAGHAILTCGSALVLGAVFYRLLMAVGQAGTGALLSSLPLEPDRLTVCGVDVDDIAHTVRKATSYPPYLVSLQPDVPLLTSLGREHLSAEQAACRGQLYAGLSPTGCGRPVLNSDKGAVWLAGLAGLAWTFAAELLLRFRVVAAVKSQGIVSPLVESTRLAIAHSWTVARHIGFLMLAVYLSNGLLVALPVLLAQRMMVPALVEASGIALLRPLLMLTIEVCVALTGALFVAFSAVYDAHLYTSLSGVTSWFSPQPVAAEARR